MESKARIILKIVAEPSQLCQFNIKRELIQKYCNTVTYGVYIIDILSVAADNTGKILNNGSVEYNVNTECRVLSPQIGETYSICITGSSKMGAVYKCDEVTIFIPKHMCSEITPEVGDSVHVNIVGKRIDGRILCIGRQVSGIK